jgi:hypothetical protein
MAWTGLARSRVWPFLNELATCQPPLIEIEARLHARAGMRRLRIVGGEWTGWTERRAPTRHDQAMKRRLKREGHDSEARSSRRSARGGLRSRRVLDNA